MNPDEDAAYLRRREEAEWAAAAEAACMARTAHEDLAETYAERATAAERATREEERGLRALLDRLDDAAG